MTRESPNGVEMSDFHHAMSTIQPSAMREIYIDVPKVCTLIVTFGYGHIDFMCLSLPLDSLCLFPGLVYNYLSFGSFSKKRMVNCPKVPSDRSFLR